MKIQGLRAEFVDLSGTLPANKPKAAHIGKHLLSLMEEHEVFKISAIEQCGNYLIMAFNEDRSRVQDKDKNGCVLDHIQNLMEQTSLIGLRAKAVEVESQTFNFHTITKKEKVLN